MVNNKSYTKIKNGFIRKDILFENALAYDYRDLPSSKWHYISALLPDSKCYRRGKSYYVFHKDGLAYITKIIQSMKDYKKAVSVTDSYLSHVYSLSNVLINKLQSMISYIKT